MSDRPTATIDLTALRRNWRAMARTEAETGAVVKADAYGHGLEPVAKALSSEGCRSFFVAHSEEGAALRQLLGSAPDIYILNGPSPGTIDAIRRDKLIPVVNSLTQLQLIIGGEAPEFALKFDTGMNRLGIGIDEMGDVRSLLSSSPPHLVMSHLACADDPDHPLNALQLERFQSISRAFPNERLSLVNSAGCFLGESYVFDLTRPGIALFGGGGHGPDPVMTLEATVLDVFDGKVGTTVGYGATAHLNRDTRLATLAIGYGDGWLRSLSGQGLVWGDGAECPVIGRVSMDLTTIDVSNTRDLRPGDRVELFGRNIDLEKQARRAGTIGYELVTGLTPRVERRYIGG